MERCFLPWAFVFCCQSPAGQDWCEKAASLLAEELPKLAKGAVPRDQRRGRADMRLELRSLAETGSNENPNSMERTYDPDQHSHPSAEKLRHVS